MRRLGEIRYILDFRQNFISLSRLDSRGYRTVAGRRILKVLCGDRIILERKKRTRGHYYLTGLLDGELSVRWSFKSREEPNVR